jgi:NAD/NADP transhydrogenase alpha subunit
VIGEGGIPASATAAVLNVTAANTTAASFFTVYPGGTMPTASDVNWGTGQVVPNLTVATLTSMGSTSIYNHAGSADVIVDAFGYFAESTAPTAPGAPTTLTATAGSGEVGLLWAAPSSDGGSVITSFNVYPRSTDQVGPLT